MRDDAIHGAELLAVAQVDVISYVGTAAAFYWGVEGEKALIRDIEARTGIKAITGATAVDEALRFLGVKKLSIFAPTTEDLTLNSVKYLEDRGFKVIGHESLGFDTMTKAKRMSPGELYAGVMRLYRKQPEVDGIFLSGGCFRTLEIIEALEKDTGLPLVTTTPANAWKCLQIAGVKEPVHGFGKMLEMSR